MMRGRHGRYELVRKLAAGGMAELYLGTVAGSPGSIVAIKQVLPQHAESAEFESMFLDEMRIASTLDHPNIVRTIDLGAGRDGFFLVMEYLHGVPLRTLLRPDARRSPKRRRGLGLAEGVAVTLGIARGLHYAHERTGADGRLLQIVHRDVTPANVILTWEGEVKLLDFGIATAANRSSETQSGLLKGKIPYMSPEQCLGEAVDRRSDVYAVGVLLFEMTTGQRWVRPAADFAMMSQIVSGTFDAPRSVSPGYPIELEAIVLRATARSPAQRYPSLAPMLADLGAFAADRRLDTSPAALTRLLLEQCGDPPPLPTGFGPHTPSPPPLPPAPPGEPCEIEVTQRGAWRIVALSGWLSDQLDVAGLAPHLTGPVVLDLSDVAWVTADGVQRWRELMQAADPSAQLWLYRCTDPLVMQLATVQGFEGRARLWSFEAPFRCTGCGDESMVELDCGHHREAFARRIPPELACDRCGAPAVYDDTANAFEVLAGLADPDPPPALRAALEGLLAPPSLPPEPPEAERRTSQVRKHLDGEITRIVASGEIVPTLRWHSALDGVEGRAVVDLSAAFVPPSASDRAARIAPLISALRAAVSATDRVRIELAGVPRPLAPPLRDASLPAHRVTLVSLQPCPGCGATAPSAPSCPACAAPVAAEPLAADPVAAPRRPPPRATLWIALAVALGMVLAASLAALLGAWAVAGTAAG